MPRRTIPWLKNDGSATKTTTKSKTKTAPIKPSTDVLPSPTPKHQRTPPKPATDEDDPLSNIEYMNSDDDQWIMVEDEFLSTAQVFTRSLHRKEYQRLQLAAASKNASQIKNIQRPVTGTSAMSRETLHKREIAAKKQLQEAQLSAASKNASEDNDSSDDEDPQSEWARSELRILMRGNMNSQASLISLIPHKHIATRAAAGYTDSQVSSGFSQRINPPPLRPRSSYNERSTPLSSYEPAATKRQPIKAEPKALKTEPILEMAASTEDEDDDDDLDALVVKSVKAVQPKPQSSVRLSSTETLAHAARRPSHHEVPAPKKEDLDFDLFPVIPIKPTTSRFKGKSMAARERALKTEQCPGAKSGAQDTLDMLFSL
ncbi:hypothetical protein FN846DRAFT_944391 [Sphaerosporella brunnea]|uniref:Uncharacterized protein n=1 Tax=Sphaerosporella brunnea TaxID=1250544 RepID=A0A5J5EZP9_9PEZI|nr:hypothetical protein FN846DRAFT_944391 [Sphaerosporella brunnea]